jgi:predicted O-methyltransferase YrrM
MVGPGADSLRQLLADPSHGPGSLDFAFIDADKGGYATYFELCLQLVRPGGCIAVDNVLFYGRVADPARTDKATAAVRAFNAALAAREGVAYCIVPIGDGVALCRKL